MPLRTCVLPWGRFFVGVHKPAFSVRNRRSLDRTDVLGATEDGRRVDNGANFPASDLAGRNGDWVYEIPNPFPFRGTTYISRAWAEEKAENPAAIGLPVPSEVSLAASMESTDAIRQAIANLPRPLKLALATTSTDPADLVCLAEECADFVHDPADGSPAGLRFRTGPSHNHRPVIHDEALFDAVANNRHLPDPYKQVMVLRPGAQGGSEIVGDRSGANGRIFEYLRTNSYIPWGHYAANFADDAVRYDLADLTLDDMTGLRHLYYQRTYDRLADQAGRTTPAGRRPLAQDELEALRQGLLTAIKGQKEAECTLDGVLWGWNFGYDYAPTDYRLHASHQQVHQQYALIPESVSAAWPEDDRALFRPAFACGDLVADVVEQYRKETGKDFFASYEKAVVENRRTDGRTDLPANLVVHEDERVMLFVPKAQTSQWELQIMPREPVGNIVEADTAMRRSLDRAIWIAARVLSALGARMITSIEFSKRIGRPDTGQRLVYSLLPRLPQSPGAFSEAQLRWINGHYPEDFARACRARLAAATGAFSK